MTDRKLPDPACRAVLRPGLLAALIASLGSQVSAQDLGPGQARDSKWEFVLGGGAIYGPTFEGSNQSETKALPLVFITYNDRLSLGIGGLSVKLYDQGPLSLTTRLGYDFGRSEDDDPDLAGLGDIEGGAAVGFGLEYNPAPFKLHADIDRSFGDSDGLVGKFGIELSRPVGRVLLGADLSATYADANHMQSYFGVTAAQSAASGYAQYTPDAGFKRADLELSATYMFADSWMIRGKIEIGKLLEDAADSPIVQEPSSITAGIFVARRF